jgi:hypothetical protein
MKRNRKPSDHHKEERKRAEEARKRWFDSHVEVIGIDVDQKTAQKIKRALRERVTRK